ncbi:hypothetical protein [Vagococcus lutrae]|uniref:hypothetical protein n=1 Tax=Vagococcus lutrae TaxID=81947 RepID=UPI00288D10A8|nr:hypothetical protein [Vagococcus lutrae]MDT2842651.1 hypothetical protein [Vagococcus lutrae]
MSIANMGKENKYSPNEAAFEYSIEKYARELINDVKEKSDSYGEVSKKLNQIKATSIFNGTNYFVVVNHAIDIIENEKNAIALKE